MVQRTEYRNLTTGTIRGGPTGHGESLTDMETYLLPMDRQRIRGLYSDGIVEGLQVSAVEGETAVRVAPGSALDRTGAFIALVSGGAAVTDPDADPDAVENVPTVVVGDDGVSVPTGATRSADAYVVLRWREVAGSAGAFVRVHAPWLRVVAVDDLTDGVREVVLARVVVEDDGTVSELDVGRRHAVGIRTGEVRLWSIQSDDTDAIGQVPAAVMFGTDEGLGMDVGGHRMLMIDGDTQSATFSGALSVGAALSVKGDSVLTGGLTVNGGLGVHSGGSAGGYSFADRGVGSFVTRPTAGERWVWYAFGGSARLWSGTDKLWLDKDGNVGLNIKAGDPIKHTVYIGGKDSSGIHIEGSGAGYSFADRLQPGYVDNPAAGQRWVWYAIKGAAKLWSGTDVLSIGAPDDGGGLDVSRRMRMRQGASDSAGTWLFQNAAPDGRGATDRAFIGMETYDTVGFWGNEFGWGLVMDVRTGNLVHRGRELGNAFGPYVLQLFGSRIQDIGGGVLSIRSGGSHVVFEPGSNVVVNGTLRINGHIFKPGGEFRIDHPQDPTGCYLRHSFVESPERLNLYAGTVVTDQQGQATIELPRYFAALNRDPLVQLTPLGELARVAVCPPVEGNRVRVVSDRPGLTVAWQVSGVRQDAWAVANPIDVEQPKPAAERGTYLHPEAFGVTAAGGITPGPAEARESHVD